MDFFDGLVPPNNMLSSLNIDAVDLSGLFPSQIPSCNSIFDNQMWSDPTQSNHNVSSFNNNIPFTINSIPSCSSIENEWDLLGHNSFYLQGRSVDNTSFDSGIHESSNPQGLQNFSSADFPTCFLQEYQADDLLNDDLLKSLVADLPAISSQSSLTRSSDSLSYNNALIEHPRVHTKEESLEDIFMAPLVDNKNVTVVPKKGLFSQLGLDQLLSNKAGSISSSINCSNKDQFFSSKRQRIDCYTADVKSCITAQPERVGDSSKSTKKRAKPGESTRPRPKDRQMTQDRLKELREIIPNGAKCSIDSLLERTIKHMIFMQGVMKYGDKMKQVDELKAQRGNDNGGISGSASWAFEAGGQKTQNPIIVEDLGHSGQMLIEMLCEEQGIFLEIADVIRSFGLTILKGVVEARDDKIWAHFIVEQANNHVTRMQVLMSLLQLLQDTSTSPLKVKTIGDKNNVLGNNTTLPLC